MVVDRPPVKFGALCEILAIWSFTTGRQLRVALRIMHTWSLKQQQ
jgi:hypothetical protein